MKNYLIDLDGTLYRGNQLTSYAKDWIEQLNHQGTGYLLCTNCPMHSPESMVHKLAALGIKTIAERILTSGMVLKNLMPEGGEIVLTGSRSYRQWLADNGFTFSDNASTAVVAFDPEMIYRDLSVVSRAIRRGARFILTNGDDVIPDGDDMIPHTGAIGAAIEKATGVRPLILGKPYSPMMDAALSILHCQVEDCIVVGDRMDTDIQFALNHGADSYLVLTGVTSHADTICSLIKPTRIFEDIQELMKWEDTNYEKQPL